MGASLSESGRPPAYDEINRLWTDILAAIMYTNSINLDLGLLTTRVLYTYLLHPPLPRS